MNTFNVMPNAPDLSTFGFNSDSDVKNKASANTLALSIITMLVVFYLAFNIMLASIDPSGALSYSILVPVNYYLVNLFGFSYPSPFIILVFTAPLTVYLSILLYRRSKSRKIANEYLQLSHESIGKAKKMSQMLDKQLMEIEKCQVSLSEMSDKIKRKCLPRLKSHFETKASIKFWDAVERTLENLHASRQLVTNYSYCLNKYYEWRLDVDNNYPVIDCRKAYMDISILIEASEVISKTIRDACNDDDIFNCEKSKLHVEKRVQAADGIDELAVILTQNVNFLNVVVSKGDTFVDDIGNEINPEARLIADFVMKSKGNK